MSLKKRFKDLIEKLISLKVFLLMLYIVVFFALVFITKDSSHFPTVITYGLSFMFGIFTLVIGSKTAQNLYFGQNGNLLTGLNKVFGNNSVTPNQTAISTIATTEQGKKPRTELENKNT